MNSCVNSGENTSLVNCSSSGSYWLLQRTRVLVLRPPLDRVLCISRFPPSQQSDASMRAPDCHDAHGEPKQRERQDRWIETKVVRNARADMQEAEFDHAAAAVSFPWEYTNASGIGSPTWKP